MRFLVCGGRDYHDQRAIEHTLDVLHAEFHFTVLIEGEAPGADKRAAAWARKRGVPVEKYPADWDDLEHPQARIAYRRDGTPYNANAGPIRNQRMIDEGKPDGAAAFPGGDGTADMVRRLRVAGIEPHFAGEAISRLSQPQHATVRNIAGMA